MDGGDLIHVAGKLVFRHLDSLGELLLLLILSFFMTV